MPIILSLSLSLSLSHSVCSLGSRHISALSAHSVSPPFGKRCVQLLIANFTEFQLATVVTFLLHETAFFLSGLPSLLFERFGLFAKYKIQVVLLFCYRQRSGCSMRDLLDLAVVLFLLFTNLIWLSLAIGIDMFHMKVGTTQD